MIVVAIVALPVLGALLLVGDLIEDWLSREGPRHARAHRRLCTPRGGAVRRRTGGTGYGSHGSGSHAA
ncbi:hypothetical protein [Streptomyces sp. NPDC088785]|uniref:hypothetical protein n=1 Tax=Streptomyces sp. NPDC088785 TaxID=3365897 RepID=UPI0037FEA4A7